MESKPALVPSPEHQSRAKLFESYARGFEAVVVAACIAFATWKGYPLLKQTTQLATDVQRTVAVTGGEEAKFWKNDWPTLRASVQTDLISLSTAASGLQPIEAQLTVTASKLNDEADALHAATLQTTATLAQGSTTLAGVQGNLNDLTTSARGTLDATTDDLKQLKTDEITANEAVANFNTLWINSQHAQGIMANLDVTSLHVAGITTTLDEYLAKVTACKRHPTFKCVSEGLLIDGIQLGGSIKELTQ